MGQIRSILQKLMFTVAAVLCIYYTVRNVSKLSIDTNGVAYLVDEWAPAYYEVLSENVGITNMNGMSNIYINMANDGYTIYKEEKTSSYIDVSFVKEGYPSYRYYFLYPEGRITFFSSTYEESWKALTYIIEYIE